jgi:hypothetical protein
MRSRRSARTASSTLISNLSTGTTVVPAARVGRRLARPVAEGTRWARRPDPPRLHRVRLEAGFRQVPVATETRSTTSSKHTEFCPWGETHGGSLGSEGRLDDTLDGVTVTKIRT